MFVLFQFGQSLFDTTQSLFEVLIGSSVRETQTLGGTKRRIAYRSDSPSSRRYWQVGRIFNHLITELLAVIIRHIGEKIECPLRHVHLETGYLTGQFHDQITTTLESPAHLLYTTLVAGESRHRAFCAIELGPEVY